MTKNPLHSCASPEWGTPVEWIERFREYLGEIDLDPASSEEHNKIVKAKVFYTKEDDGLSKTWHGRVFLNPPGGRGVPQKFVEKLCQEYFRGDVEDFVYLGYSLEQLRWWRDHWWGLNCNIFIVRQRMKFRGAGDHPTHGNFIAIPTLESWEDWEINGLGYWIT